MGGTEVDIFCEPKRNYRIRSLAGGRKTRGNQVLDVFLNKRLTSVTFEFQVRSSLCFYKFFLELEVGLVRLEVGGCKL